MKISHLYCTLLIVFTLITNSFGQSITLQQSNPSGIYKAGENIKITASFDSLDADSINIIITQHDRQELLNKKVQYTGNNIELFNASYAGPMSMMLTVRAGKIWASTGLVIAPENFTPGSERPADFDAWWAQEKAALRALPMEIKFVPVDSIQNGFVCSDVEINCTGPKPARGYLAKPANAGPKSLPIVLFVHAAGVSGDWCLSKPENAMQYAAVGKGALSFDLNAHGMLNGQPLDYYKNLEKGELAGYFFQGMQSRDDFYFRGMYLRLIRTLDFLTSQPEWDGERILVWGESQGGGQALAAAGLDHRVTAAVAIVPAMCDWGGRLAGRKGGWPNPFSAKHDMEKLRATLPYFDVAHLLKGSNATLVTEIGYIDQTCPAAAVYAAINQSAGEKIVLGVPYRGHHLDQQQFKETWEQTVYTPRKAFIEEFLK